MKCTEPFPKLFQLIISPFNEILKCHENLLVVFSEKINELISGDEEKKMTTPKLIRSVSKRLQNHITTGDTQQAENVTKLVGQLLLEIVKIILPFLPLSYFF